MLVEIKVQPGLYRHYKGDLYRVTHTALHSETQERLVVYQNVASGSLWVRPEAMFLDTVKKDGLSLSRFAWISE